LKKRSFKGGLQEIETMVQIRMIAPLFVTIWRILRLSYYRTSSSRITFTTTVCTKRHQRRDTLSFGQFLKVFYPALCRAERKKLNTNIKIGCFQ
jgi:hypothetical protein